MPEAPAIRAYAPGDRGAVLACLAELQDAERALDPRLPPGEEMAAAYLDAIEQRCARCDGRLLVADVGGAVQGFVSVYARVPYDSPDDPPGSFALLGDLVVLRVARQHGLARALVRAAEEVARAAGASELRAEAPEGNAPAARLYDSTGFERYLVTRRKRLRPDDG